MRDGAVIFFVCVVLIGSIGWLFLRANGINPFVPATVTVQAKDEVPTKDKDQKVERPAHSVGKMPVAVKVKAEMAAVKPVVIPYIEVEPTDVLQMADRRAGPSWETWQGSRSDTEEALNEGHLSDNVAFCQPSDLTFSDHVHRLVSFNCV
jgi:hypothetical protein